MPDQPFCISRAINIRIIKAGREALPVLIVDQVLAEPRAMMNYAAGAEFYVPPHTHYPGVNANLPEDYYRAVIAVLRQPLEVTFGLSSQSYLNYFGFLGLSTRPAADATPAQRFPHVDSYDPNRLAMVHYFCSETYGGTGVFRQQATGIRNPSTRAAPDTMSRPSRPNVSGRKARPRLFQPKA